MRGIEVPDRTQDFTSDPVELFFDLSFVFAFSQLVGLLVVEPTWSGAGKRALVFGLIWLPWTQFTWSANAISGNGRPVRMLFLVATALSVPMAAATTTALGEGGTVFAVMLSIILGLALSMLTLNLRRGTSEFRSAVEYSIPNVIAMAVLIGGSFTDGSTRLWLWCCTLAIVFVGTLRAGSGDWIVRSGHFAERHGLIVIIALGEVIVAIGVPVVSALEARKGLPGATVVALIAAGAFAGLLWWSYFDRPQPALEHFVEQLPDLERGRFVRDIYTYAHAPLVAGVILSAAALEEITLHPTDSVEPAFRLMLFGGLALCSVGVAAAVLRAFGLFARERLAAVVVIGILALASSRLDGVVLLVCVDLVILAMLIVEHLRIERPEPA